MTLARVVLIVFCAAAVAMGIVWGVLGLEGGVGFFSFFPVLAGVSFAYVTKIMGVDDEDFGRNKVFTLLVSLVGFFTNPKPLRFSRKGSCLRCPPS
jgi:hypothetical protein